MAAETARPPENATVLAPNPQPVYGTLAVLIQINLDFGLIMSIAQMFPPSLFLSPCAKPTR